MFTGDIHVQIIVETAILWFYTCIEDCVMPRNAICFNLGLTFAASLLSWANATEMLGNALELWPITFFDDIYVQIIVDTAILWSYTCTEDCVMPLQTIRFNLGLTFAASLSNRANAIEMRVSSLALLPIMFPDDISVQIMVDTAVPRSYTYIEDCAIPWKINCFKLGLTFATSLLICLNTIEM